MRLWNPCTCGSGPPDTSVSGWTGVIPGGGIVAITLSPYSFYPDVLCSSLLRIVDMRLRNDFLNPPNADTPRFTMVNQSAGQAWYKAEWRHINP